MKKFFLFLTALAFCAAFSGCSKDNADDTVESIWESRSEAGILTLQFIDESTCSITTGSGQPGVYSANFEIFEYSRWFGPNYASLFDRGDTEKKWENTRYIAKYSDDTHLTLVPLRGGEEVQSDALVLTRKR